MNFEITEINSKDIDQVLSFCSKWIGQDYFQREELSILLAKGAKGSLNASLKAMVGDELAGIRLSLAPGCWIDETSRGLTQELWNIDSSLMAQFKSLFVSGDFQKMGIGKALSEKSISILKKMGAKGILCHSWLESPGNSSQLYLKSFDFQVVKTHEEFWSSIDYCCTRCGGDKCLCTAVEMVKYV